MKTIYVYQIVDTLSESITHTFMSASFKHAARQFRQFLDSLKGKIQESDFVLLEVSEVNICETYQDACDCIDNSSYRTLFGESLPEDFKVDEVQSDES